MYVHTPLFVPSIFQQHSRDGDYGAAVACIDWAAGAIMHALHRQGLADETLVIFTSDNGSGRPECNAPLRGNKGTTWEGGMRLPCIMRWPGEIPADRVCHAVTSAMDFYPTLAALGGAEVPDDRIIDGKDIRQLMTGASSESPYEAFFYYMSNRLEAVRKGTWKLHVGKKFGQEYRNIRELYDLEDDPGETNNRYSDEPEVVTELSELLDRCRKDIGDEATGVAGENRRPIGRVDRPDTRTHFDPNHPYIIQEYDLEHQQP